MIINEQSHYKYQIKKTLNKMHNVNKRQYNFTLEIFGLYLSLKGRFISCNLPVLVSLVNKAIELNHYALK